jgi:hypothetical protein
MTKLTANVITNAGTWLASPTSHVTPVHYNIPSNVIIIIRPTLGCEVVRFWIEKNLIPMGATSFLYSYFSGVT